MAEKKPDAALETMLANLPEKTGKSLDEWLDVLATAGFDKHGEIVKHLKSTYGVTHGFANLIAHRYRDSLSGESVTEDDLVVKQYSGAKAGLKPIYDSLLRMVEAFGKDLEIAPKNAYVSLRRSKQFALIQPSTRDRVDVGIKLAGVEPTERLELSGSFNAMVTHRVRVTAAEQVDAELRRWLQTAYEQA